MCSVSDRARRVSHSVINRLGGKASVAEYEVLRSSALKPCEPKKLIIKEEILFSVRGYYSRRARFLFDTMKISNKPKSTKIIKTGIIIVSKIKNRYEFIFDKKPRNISPRTPLIINIVAKYKDFLKLFSTMYEKVPINNPNIIKIQEM